jgi:hypothetical protein
LRKSLRKVGLALIPLLVTSLVFLILFNNILYGRLILVTLILINAGFISALSLWTGLSEYRKPAILMSVYIIAVLAAWLLIETLFPLLLPKDCGEILNLAKTPFSSSIGAGFNGLVYDNKQAVWGTSSAVSHGRERLSWHDPGGKYVYRGYDPNQKRKYINIVYWNSHGYYDVDRSLKKTPGTYRIVLIGDSFVESIQVPLLKTYHKLLEKDLNSPPVLGPNKKVEVIALGTSGAGQIKNHTVLVKEGLRYHPDLVGITLYANDFCDDDPVLSDEMAYAAGFPGVYIRRFAQHRYYAIAFVLRRLDSLRREKNMCDPELFQWCKEDIPRVEAAWKRTLDCVQASRDVCEKRGIKFVLIYIGSKLEVKHALDPDTTIARLKELTGRRCCVSWDMGKSLRRVSSYCAVHKIPFISLLGPLIKAQRTSGKIMFEDHYTAAGHQVAARTLFCSLRLLINPSLASKPLPPCCVSETRNMACDHSTTPQPHRR